MHPIAPSHPKLPAPILEQFLLRRFFLPLLRRSLVSLPPSPHPSQDRKQRVDTDDSSPCVTLTFKAIASIFSAYCQLVADSLPANRNTVSSPAIFSRVAATVLSGCDESPPTHLPHVGTSARYARPAGITHRWQVHSIWSHVVLPG